MSDVAIAEQLGQELATESASLYATYVHWIAGRPGLPAQGVDAIRIIEQSLRAALRSRENVRIEDLPLTTHTLAPLIATGEWEDVINPFALGWGDEAAGVVVMGTEEAYEPDSDLVLWNCGGAILRLCGSRIDVVVHLAEGRRPDGWGSLAAHPLPSKLGPFHVDTPYWMDHVRKRIPPRGTWACLRHVLGIEDAHDVGHGCYQIERSARPALTAVAGVPPTRDRRRFLAWASSRLSSANRVLLIQGRATTLPGPDSDVWTNVNSLVTSAFLGVEDLPSAEKLDVDDGRSIFRFVVAERTALWTRQLSGQNVTDEYLDHVGAEIRSARKRS